MNIALKNGPFKKFMNSRDIPYAKKSIITYWILFHYICVIKLQTTH